MIDIVIQGPYTPYTDEVIEEYLQAPFVNKVIISHWESDSHTSKWEDSRVESVKSPDYTKYPGPANVNLQLTTSLTGVKASESKYVAKFRSDQKFTKDSLARMWQFFMNNQKPGRIFVCGNVFEHLFHPKDWVYWGERDDMINLFNAPHEVNELCEKNGVNSGNYGGFMRYLTRPETYIGAHYCALYDPRVKEMVDNEAEYLYDGAPSWTQAKEISDTVTKECFKCLAREGITMEWPRKNINCLPFDPSNEGWDEEGF